MSGFSKSLTAMALSVFAAGLAMGQSVTSSSGHSIDVSFTSDSTNATFRASGEPVDPVAFAADPALLDAATFKIFVDTESDILLVDAALTIEEGLFYNVPASRLGSDVGPLSPAVDPIGGFENLVADSWITTPSFGTAAAGSSTLASGLTVTHFDTVDSGPQTNFQFGQITLIPNAEGFASATVTGFLATSGDPLPFSDEYQFTLQITPVPEPGSLTLLSAAGLFGLLAFRRKKSVRQ